MHKQTIIFDKANHVVQGELAIYAIKRLIDQTCVCVCVCALWCEKLPNTRNHAKQCAHIECALKAIMSNLR